MQRVTVCRGAPGLKDEQDRQQRGQAPGDERRSGGSPQPGKDETGRGQHRHKRRANGQRDREAGPGRRIFGLCQPGKKRTTRLRTHGFIKSESLMGGPAKCLKTTAVPSHNLTSWFSTWRTRKSASLRRGCFVGT